jgi:hypothetical protein
MPIRRLHVRHVCIAGLLLLSAVAMQGCLAIVWLGAVGVDTARTSDIEFQSFENSWVAAPQEREQLRPVKSIAVMPFVGDPVMAERWTAVFREMTDLRVVSLPGDVRDGVSEQEQIALAQQMSATSQVDCVLIGNVAGQESKKTFVGLKEISPQRLYLHLVSHSGTLMWKTELPYTIAKGAKDLDEDMVTQALLAHVRIHADDVGLVELGVRNQQTTSGSLRD